MMSLSSLSRISLLLSLAILVSGCGQAPQTAATSTTGLVGSASGAASTLGNLASGKATSSAAGTLAKAANVPLPVPKPSQGSENVPNLGTIDWSKIYTGPDGLDVYDEDYTKVVPLTVNKPAASTSAGKWDDVIDKTDDTYTDMG